MKRIDFRDLQKYLHEIPTQFHSDELLKKIHSMDAHTAYALLGGYLAPLLRAPTKVTTAPKPLHLETIVRADVAEVAHADLRNLKDIREGKESKLPQIEELMKKLIEKFKKYIDIFPKSKTHIDGDGHTSIDRDHPAGDLYDEIDSITKQIRNLIGGATVDWNQHPELRRKYSEILVVLTAIIPPAGGSSKWVLPLIHAKIVFKDLEKALKEIYESRSELEERALKDLQDRLNKLKDVKDKEIGGLEDKITDLKDRETSNKNRIATLEQQIRDLESGKTKNEGDLLKKDQEISRLKDELQKAKDDLAEVTDGKNKEIDKLDKKIEKKDEEIGKLEDQIKELKQKIKDQKELDGRIDQLLREKEELENSKGREISKLQEQIADLDKRIRDLEALKELEITALQEDLEKVRDQLKIKEKEIKDGKIDEMGKELPDLQNLLKDLEEGGIDLRDLNKLREKIHDLNKLTKEDKDAVKDIGDLQKDIKALRDELQRQKKIELERKEKEKEISDRENKLDELQRKILGLREELKNLESLKGKDLTKFREKLEELEKLKNKVGDSNDKVKALEDEVNRLRKELNKDKQIELDKQQKIKDEQEEVKRKEREKELEKIREIKLKELKEKQGMMDAYIFMIVVFLTQLHTKQAEKLKAHGETLKKISQIFDQWNKIQSSLNTISQNGITILQWIKQRKIDSNYTLYTDDTLKKKETDSDKLAIWNNFKSFIPNLQKNIKDLRSILDEVKRSLPDSATSLLNTMYKLSEKLLDIPDAKGLSDLNTYLKVTDPSEKEKRIEKEIGDLKKADREMEMKINRNVEERMKIKDEVGWFYWNMSDSWLPAAKYKLKQRWNELAEINEGIYKDRATNAERIREKESELRRERREKTALPDKRLTILEWISDSDQTQFKSYMDNLAQGVTALTSVSNMVQQQLQLDTQYYNSLLGLQKAGMDSLTKTVQGILANMRS